MYREPGPSAYGTPSLLSSSSDSTTALHAAESARLQITICDSISDLIRHSWAHETLLVLHVLQDVDDE